MRTTRRFGVVAFCLLGMGSLSARSLLGQGGQWAFRPSQLGPTTSLSRTLGRISYLSGNTGPQRITPGNVSTLAPTDLKSWRTQNRPRPTYNPFGQSAPRPSTTGSLLGRRYSGADTDWMTPTGGLASPYPEISVQRPGLLMRRPDLSGGGGAATGSIQAVATSRPADSFRPAATLVSLDQLAQDYIRTRRTAYVQQAWQKFGDRKYRLAGEVFELAQSLSLDDPLPRAEIELGIMASAIAARQYMVAINSLRWLLTPDRRTGQLPDLAFLDRLAEVKAHYTGNEADYSEHSRALESLAIANPRAVELQALRSILLWGRADRAGAIFYAKVLTEAPEPWSGLVVLMERASAGTVPSSRPVETSSSILMPELVATPK